MLSTKITTITRKDSLNKLDKSIRYTQIIYILEKYPEGLTARKIANNLGSQERNYVAPRCTELVEKGILRVITKEYDEFTKRKVAVYVLNKKEF